MDTFSFTTNQGSRWSVADIELGTVAHVSDGVKTDEYCCPCTNFGHERESRSFGPEAAELRGAPVRNYTIPSCSKVISEAGRRELISDLWM